MVWKLSMLAVAVLLLTGCGGQQAISGGPRLLEDVALEVTDAPPSRTPDPAVTIVSAAGTASETPVPQITSERMSPLQVATVPADYVLVTPTLPPSKTPTGTPTDTVTPSVTPSPTITITATATAPLFPTALISPTPAIVAQPLPAVCPNLWAYLQLPVSTCPLAPPTAKGGVYQTFINNLGQESYMLWVDQGLWQDNDPGDDQIYVLFGNGTWRLYQDYFYEMKNPDGSNPPAPQGSPWTDPAVDSDPNRPAGRWQPARGFGMIWRESYFGRSYPELFTGVGWASMEQEQPYNNQQYYQDPAGTIFVNRPDGVVFGMFPNGTWQMYASSPYQNAPPPVVVTVPPADATSWIYIPPGQ